LFQFVNTKAWVICITAVSLFYPEKENLIVGTLFMLTMSTIINLPSISVWAFGGSIIRYYLTNEKLKKIIEWFLAILLSGTAVLIIL
jgi:threonine/homoserine/homoserine lactone efflux protein